MNAGRLRMNAGRLPLFCDIALAERIERAEVGLIAGAAEAARRRRPEAGGFAIPVAGGLATFAEAASPFNKVAGLGFGDAPGAEALDEIERSFADRGVPVQVELADAAAAGCDIAVVTTQPGSKSQQNVQRRGFDLLYTRAVLVKGP